MRTSIALLPALAVAAALRPPAELPVRPKLPPPAPPVVLNAPPDIPSRPGLLEVLAGALRPTAPQDARFLNEVIPLHTTPDASDLRRRQEEDRLELMSDEELWRELLHAESRMQFTRGKLLAGRLLERNYENLDARRIFILLDQLRRLRLDAFRNGARLDSHEREDLDADEWKEVAEAVLDNRRVSLDVTNVLMADALAEVRAETGLPIILDAKVVDRLTPDLRVTVRASNITARQAIRFILDQSEWWLEIAPTEEKVVLLRSDRAPDRD